MSMIGKTLGTFTLEAQIGKGGMGEVYQAKDQKLGRDVAIKILPEEFARDAERVARFHREAKLLASLNHPNIAAIHGLEEAEGTHFLVLELVEGDTLADRLKRGAIPVEEALKLALQIAEALESAHEKGVIHRDLKPANIKVTPEGKVMVLDFGLAKAFAGDQSDLNLSNSPTLSEAATMQGVILGTAAYMPPEQAKGKSVDKRADIWAFGVVLFEMLSGRTLFTGETVSETLASVIKSEPEWKSLPPNLHPRIRLLLERCLEKEPKDRYGVIGDARVDIQRVLEDPSGVFKQALTEAKPRSKMRTILPWAAATLVLGSILAWFLKPASPPEPKQVMRFYQELPQDQRFTQTAASVVDLSPDGTKIVYVANRRLYLRNLNELNAIPIQGTFEDPANPFFSPDGQSVGYYSHEDRQWKKITVSGGAPFTICDAYDPSGATWGADGTILFAESNRGAIMRVSENGGIAKPIIEVEEGDVVHGPQILPGGEWVLFTVTRATGISRWDDAQIVVQSLKTGEHKVLIPKGSDARYVVTGHLVYALGNALFAIPFDGDNLDTTGGAVSIIEGIQRASQPQFSTATANYDFSNGGLLVYVPGGNEGVTEERESLVWISRDGKEEPIKAPPRDYDVPQISPDGNWVAFDVDTGGNLDIRVWNLVEETMNRLTFDEHSDVNPLWTPDGKRIAFSSDREGSMGIYWKAADGTGAVEQLCSVPNRSLFTGSWSGDGSALVLMELDYQYRGVDIGILSMEAAREYKPLLHEKYNESQPQVSPDGRWLAYMSDESGRYEVFVRPFPDVNKGMWQISENGGNEPRWSRDGRELFYRSGDAIMVVSVKSDPTFSYDTPRNIIRGVRDYVLRADFCTFWDVSPDSKRILMLQELTGDTSTGETSRPKINIIANWFEELKERVPVE